MLNENYREKKEKKQYLNTYELFPSLSIHLSQWNINDIDPTLYSENFRARLGNNCISSYKLNKFVTWHNHPHKNWYYEWIL